MTLMEGLEILKNKGITKMSGMYGKSDINEYIANAIEAHEISLRYADVPCHKYSLDHEDEYFMVEFDGHHIIATHYDNFDMATYSDYDTQEEMYAAFDEWKIMRDAEAIADEMAVMRPGELPRAAWVLVASSELRAANKAAMEAFDREFPQI